MRNEATGEMDRLTRFPLGGGVISQCFMQNKPMVGQESDTRHDIDYAFAGSIRSYVFLPIYGFCKEVVGVLELVNKLGGGRLDEAELRKLAPYQHIVGLTIKNIYEFTSNAGATVALKRALNDITSNIEPDMDVSSQEPCFRTPSI